MTSHHLATDKHWHWKSPTEIVWCRGWWQPGAVVQIFLSWPYYFFFFNSLGPSLSSTPFVCLLSSRFIPSSALVSYSLKGVNRCSTYTHLFSFCCQFLCIGSCQCWYKSFNVPFPSHMNSWENQYLENMEMTLSAFMSLWKWTIYFVLLQLIISSARSISVCVTHCPHSFCTS